MALGNATLNALEALVALIDSGRLKVSGDGTILTPGTYLGDQVIAGNDANQNATIPDGTTAVLIQAEGGPVYAEVNGVAAVATAGIYVPENSIRIVGPYNNLTSLGVYAATGDKARLIYES
jgi:hypothetical protein